MAIDEKLTIINKNVNGVSVHGNLRDFNFKEMLLELSLHAICITHFSNYLQAKNYIEQ